MQGITALILQDICPVLFVCLFFFFICAVSFIHCWLKWYYDKNHIFPLEVILKQRRSLHEKKNAFTIYKYLFLFQRYSSF